MSAMQDVLLIVQQWQRAKKEAPQDPTIDDTAMQDIVRVLMPGTWINGDDVYRLAKEIDVAMNDRDAAPRPALCDVTAQLVHGFSGMPGTVRRHYFSYRVSNDYFCTYCTQPGHRAHNCPVRQREHPWLAK